MRPVRDSSTARAIHRLLNPSTRRDLMSKIIVSYDGSSNDDDAVALGRILAGAGSDVALAYVRHSSLASRDVAALAEKAADQLLERGARSIGNPDAQRHVTVNASTPDGLAELA